MPIKTMNTYKEIIILSVSYINTLPILNVTSQIKLQTTKQIWLWTNVKPSPKSRTHTTLPK